MSQDLIIEDHKINWYPGHMAKALKQIQEKTVVADLFVVVLDSRAPISSYNEVFDKIEPSKPRLFVISKSDLGDKNKLGYIKKRFDSSDNVIDLNLQSNNARNQLLKRFDKLLEPKRKKELKKGLLKPRLRIFVVGVPNSGKSTLINLLAQGKKTKVGNMPGVTRGQQWVRVGDYQLLDTPGMLWPDLNDQTVAIKLAIIGAIKESVIPLDMLFNLSYFMVSSYYPKKLEEINLEPALDEVGIFNQLNKIATLKSMYLKNNVLDLDKARRWFYEVCRNWKGVTYD